MEQIQKLRTRPLAAYYTHTSSSEQNDCIPLASIRVLYVLLPHCPSPLQLPKLEHPSESHILYVTPGQLFFPPHPSHTPGRVATNDATYPHHPRQERIDEPSHPRKVALPDVSPRPEPEHLGDDGLRVRLVRHGVLLAVLRAALVFGVDGQVERGGWEGAVGAGDVRPHAAGDHGGDLDADPKRVGLILAGRGNVPKGCQFDPQSVTVGVQGCFGRVVHAAEYVRHHACQATQLHDGASGGDEEWREGLAHAHHGEDVDGEGGSYFFEVDVEGRDGVICFLGKED
ncbi:MAG: hypothetical protein M1827_005854 [Pycnora praestabilis]|nr:MAG: hypothetical protein M1827_005854 [Pycnora praestabilis]